LPGGRALVWKHPIGGTTHAAGNLIPPAFPRRGGWGRNARPGPPRPADAGADGGAEAGVLAEERPAPGQPAADGTAAPAELRRGFLSRGPAAPVAFGRCRGPAVFRTRFADWTEGGRVLGRVRRGRTGQRLRHRLQAKRAVDVDRVLSRAGLLAHPV